MTQRDWERINSINILAFTFAIIAQASVVSTREEMQCLFCLVITIQGVPRRAKTSHLIGIYVR